MEHFYVRGPQSAERTWRNAGRIRPRGQAAAQAERDAARLRRTAEWVASAKGAPQPQLPTRVPEIAAEVVGCEVVEGDGADGTNGLAPVTPAGSSARSSEPGDVPHEPLAPPTDVAPDHADPGMGYIFEHTRGKKCLIFVNSREECEAVTTTLRQYCEIMHEPDRFLIHHGNLSAAYRETAEAVMKDDEQFRTTVTTATLELGIDIGRLERAFQIDAPFTVSSFLQRMGRTGRRDLPPEMWFVMREEQPEPRAMLPTTIPWKLLQGIALVQLYLEERWVEPPKLDRLPYSLLYHQTMCTLASCGEMTPAALASRVLSLSYFHRVTQDDFRLLLRHLLETEHIQRTETGGLIVGLAGERLTSSLQVLRGVSGERGVHRPQPLARARHTSACRLRRREHIALAGQVWVVEEVDHKRHLVYCDEVKGRVPAYFGQCPGDINTRVLERMRRCLREMSLSLPHGKRRRPPRAGAPRGRQRRRRPRAARMPGRRLLVPVPLAGELCLFGA